MFATSKKTDSRGPKGTPAPNTEFLVETLDLSLADLASLLTPGEPGRPPGRRDPEGQPPEIPGFTLLEEIGRGGFGAVYRARDEILGRQVALKVLLPEWQDRAGARDDILREARALASIRHPNVVTVHGVVDDGESLALVMELIDGVPLDRMVERSGPFGAVETAHVGIEICRALAAVHAAGLIHRDLKTSNIARERGGRIVLMDFGLGLPLDGEAETRASGSIAGSPLFMAPEQIDGGKLHPRTDIYTLGVALYHLSTGRYPADGEDLADLLAAIQAGRLVPVRDARPDLPAGVARVITRSLATQPEKRYQSAGEMEQALLECLVDPSS